MIVGQREESVIEKSKRHLKEMKADIKGWETELKHAREKGNSKHEVYCSAMIKVRENTINKLE